MVNRIPKEKFQSDRLLEATNIYYEVKRFWFGMLHKDRKVHQGNLRLKYTIRSFDSTKLYFLWAQVSLTKDQKTRHVKWCREKPKTFDKVRSWYVNNIVKDDVVIRNSWSIKKKKSTLFVGLGKWVCFNL